MNAVKLKDAQAIVDQIERSVRLAKRLRCLNMFITETFADALDKAKASTSTRSDVRKQGLYGAPIAVKDCYSTKDVLTTCGSKMLSNYKPLYTATVVQKLFDAGAIMLGKTNMDEFSMGASSTDSFYGPVKNPWTLQIPAEQSSKGNAEHSPTMKSDWYLAGGSSGGSAVAVSTGVARIALGSDTGGSTRNPAAFCGVVGLKPTYGLLSRYGLIPLVNSLDTPGIFARTVDDAALTLETLAGKDSNDSTSIDRPSESFLLDEEPSVRGLTIGLPAEYYIRELSDDVADWWQKIAGLLEHDGGCKLKTVNLPFTRFSIVCYHVLGESEIASNMARYTGIEYGYRGDDEANHSSLLAAGRSAAFNEVVRRRIFAGNYFLLKSNYEKYFLKALKVRRLIADDFYRVFRQSPKADILLTPATLSDAPLYSEWKGDEGHGYDRERKDDFFTQPVNMAGVAAVTVPVGLSRRGLPIGLQLISDRLEEKKLLTVAKWIEKRVQFPFLNGEQLCRFDNQ